MSIHEGHRARLKQRFAEDGERALNDHQLLELLLFYAIPQGDVEPLAHRLIERFGSLAAVLDADPAQLQTVEGVGAHTALLLSLIPQLMRRYEQCRRRADACIVSAADAGDYLLPCFVGARNEAVYLLCLDAAGRVQNCVFLAEGEPDRVMLDSELVAETARSNRAVSVILAHNHLCGPPVPSRADISLTLALRDVLNNGGIRLTDHLIIADGEFLSLVESGFIPKI